MKKRFGTGGPMGAPPPIGPGAPVGVPPAPPTLAPPPGPPHGMSGPPPGGPPGGMPPGSPPPPPGTPANPAASNMKLIEALGLANQREQGKKRGGKVKKKMAKGGSFRSSGNGIATRGKTKGRFV